MAGYKANTRIWLHNRKEKLLVQSVTIKDQLKIAGLLLIGFKKGMGPKKKSTRPPRTKVINETKAKETKWINRSDLHQFLLDNPEWRQGSGISYNKNNKGNIRGNYGQKKKGYHFSSPRPHLIGSKRMYLPGSTKLGKYVIPSEVDHYLSLNYIFGIRLSDENEKVICEKCFKMLTPTQLNGFHEGSDYCKQIEKRNLLESLFIKYQERGGIKSKRGFSKSYYLRDDQTDEAQRYRFLKDSLRP